MILRKLNILSDNLESVAQGGSSVVTTIGGAIYETLNGVGDLDEKIVGSLWETASKVIELTGHTVKDSTTGVGNTFHGILGVLGGTIQWCIILLIILVLTYINRATLLKFYQRKSSDLADWTTKSSTNLLTSTTTSPPTLSTNSHSAQNGFNYPTPAPNQPHVLHLVLGSLTLHEDSTSQKKSGMVISTPISSQNDHMPCSALINTDSPVTLVSEKF